MLASLPPSSPLPNLPPSPLYLPSPSAAALVPFLTFTRTHTITTTVFKNKGRTSKTSSKNVTEPYGFGNVTVFGYGFEGECMRAIT